MRASVKEVPQSLPMSESFSSASSKRGTEKDKALPPGEMGLRVQRSFSGKWDENFMQIFLAVS